MSAEQAIANSVMAKCYECPDGDIYKMAEQKAMEKNGDFNYGPIGADNYMTRNNSKIIDMNEGVNKITGNYSSKAQLKNIIPMVQDSYKRVA